MTVRAIWLIRVAEARDAEALPTLENSAGALFRSFPSLEWLADGEDLSVGRYRELIAAGASWVAIDPDDRPIAFLSGSIEENDLHIWELGVRRDLQRFGIGRNLLLAAIRDARCRRLAAVTLTTFRDVPWNAPFYARLGFESLAGEAIGDRLERILRADARRGLPMHARCAMRLRLS
ncbi:MAG TPA: GNAT family N-acetyltransferase [Methylocystis sp.]